MNRPRFLRIAAVVAIAGAGLALMNSFAPLQAPTVLVYSGFVVLLFAFISILLPPAWLGFQERMQPFLGSTLSGLVLVAAGFFWPLSSFSTPSPSTRLDAFLPSYNFHERHEIMIQASSERVREVLDQITLADVGVMQTLGNFRAAAMGRAGVDRARQEAAMRTPLLEVVKHPRSGFFLLDDTPKEFVFGLAGQPWNNAGVLLKRDEFRSWAPPGNVKIAANFLIEESGNGRCRVVTETRVAATDASAGRKMAKYWALIYPGSAMIRRDMLKLIRERAESFNPPAR